MLLAVMFSYVVGFALLWCAESFAYRMKRKLQPVVYAVTGAIGFGVWTVWVVLGVMNMISGGLGMGTVSADHTTIAAIDGAVLGLALVLCRIHVGGAPCKTPYRSRLHWAWPACCSRWVGAMCLPR